MESLPEPEASRRGGSGLRAAGRSPPLPPARPAPATPLAPGSAARAARFDTLFDEARLPRRVPRPLRVHFSATPGRVHNLYSEYTDHPPEGVEFVLPGPGQTGYVPPKGQDDAPPAIAAVQRSTLFRRIYRPVLQHALGGLGVRERAAKLKGEPRPWDVYHAVGGVHPYPEPWVVSFESALDFFGFAAEPRHEVEDAGARRYARRKLLSRHCRKLMPWTDAARRSVLATFPDVADALDAKTEVVPLALRAGPEPPPRDADPARRPRILFVGSKNFPQDFIPNKGGNLALEAFAELRARGHDVDMVVRALVPDTYRARFEGTPGLRIVDGMLTDAELRALYHESDVFLFPGHHTPGMVILEGMRAGLPVVALDVWANREIVSDGRTGLLVPPPAHVPYLTRTGAPNWSHDPEFLDAVQRDTGPTVRALADALGRLLKDPALRRRMGDAGRAEVRDGRFSIARRNAALRRIYEEAAGAPAHS